MLKPANISIFLTRCFPDRVRVMKLVTNAALFLTVLIPLWGWAGPSSSGTYILGQLGYMRVSQEKAIENDVYPSGPTYGGGIGYRQNFMEFEGFFVKGSAEGEINHDGVKNNIVHSQSSMILAGNFYFNSAIYARFGYGFHKVKQELSKGVSAASEAGATKEYGLKDDTLTEGIIFGGGLVFFDTKSTAFFTQLERYDFGTMQSAAWNWSLGFRFYLK